MHRIFVNAIQYSVFYCVYRRSCSSAWRSGRATRFPGTSTTLNASPRRIGFPYSRWNAEFGLGGQIWVITTGAAVAPLPTPLATTRYHQKLACDEPRTYLIHSSAKSPDCANSRVYLCISLTKINPKLCFGSFSLLSPRDQMQYSFSDHNVLASFLGSYFEMSSVINISWWSIINIWIFTNPLPYTAGSYDTELLGSCVNCR